METNKEFYRSYADEITQKRAESPYALRRYAHEQQYEAVARHVRPGMRVLDAGCGEGVLSFMMAARGAEVVGIDISEPNIEAANAKARELGVSNLTFMVGDAERLPFADSSFDLVVSSHVLEHLPDFDAGLNEVMRVTRSKAVVAIPTALNLCSWVQLGGGWFFVKGLRSFLALGVGMVRVAGAALAGKEGVDEGYAGTSMTHIFRFPGVLRRKAAEFGYRVTSQEASSVCLPYFEFLLPVTRVLDRYKRAYPLHMFGYGTTYVLEKR